MPLTPSVRMFDATGDHVDVPQDHPLFANYRAKFPHDEAPSPEPVPASEPEPEPEADEPHDEAPSPEPTAKQRRKK